MNESEERALYEELLADEGKRNRKEYDYTIDALLEGAITPLGIWPESNKNVYNVLAGKVKYNDLPFDENNEYHKGVLWLEQQDIILRNNDKEPLCEALEMTPCIKEHCELYNSELGPPICKEYKMAFKK